VSKLFRVDRLALLLIGILLLWCGSLSFQMLFDGFTSGPITLSLLLLVNFVFVVCGAHDLDKFARGEFLKQHEVLRQQTELGTQSALASGMQAIAERLCDLVLALDAELGVCEQTTAVDSFFGRPMFGVCISDVLIDDDADRAGRAFSEASRSLVPQCLSVTLMTHGGRRIEASLLVTDTGMARQRFIVGISVDREHFPEAEAELTFSVAMASRRSDQIDAEISSACTAHIFETQSLEQIAELGRKEHWWIDLGELMVPKPVRILGHGGFGVVAVAELLGQAVAVKTLRSDRADQARLRTFLDELRILRYARHQHVVAFLGAAIDPVGFSVCIVYELIGGAQLDAYVSSRPLEDFDRVKVAMQTCSALRYLHGHSPVIIHGDLKAGNVLVDTGATGPTAKLIDFGLSCVASLHACANGGTLGWAAPELYAPDVVAATSADIYSFGWLLHLTITNQLPFGGMKGQRLREAITQLLADRTTPVLDAPPECLFREESLRLCTMCMCFDASDRPDIPAVHQMLKSWTGLVFARQLGVALTSSMLMMRDWRGGGKDLITACLRDGNAPPLQVDLHLGDTVTVMHADGADSVAKSSGRSFCDLFEEPDALEAVLRSTLADLRHGSGSLPMMQTLCGVRLLGDDGQINIARMLFLDTSGAVSLRLARQALVDPQAARMSL